MNKSAVAANKIYTSEGGRSAEGDGSDGFADVGCGAIFFDESLSAASEDFAEEVA